MTNIESGNTTSPKSSMDALFDAYVKFIQGASGKAVDVAFASKHVIPALDALLQQSVNVGESQVEVHLTAPFEELCKRWISMGSEGHSNFNIRAQYEAHSVEFAQCVGEMALCLFDDVARTYPTNSCTHWEHVRHTLDKNVDEWNWRSKLYQRKNVERKFSNPTGKKHVSMVQYLMRMFFECWKFNEDVTKDGKCQSIHKALCAKLEGLKQ